MPEPEQGTEPGDDATRLNPGSGGVLGRLVLVCGAITAGAGALILAGWATGSDALTAMGTGYIPMAPNSALLFVLLGSAMLVREVWPTSRVMHRAAAVAAVSSVVVGSVTLIGFAVGLNIDDSLFRTTRMLGAMPMGRMSPVTAFCFGLAGVSLLLLEWQLRTWAAILGTLIALAGAVCLMGYWFGAPLLYGGTVIPVALPTSLALVALGVGLTAAAGPGTWPLSTLIGPSTRAQLLRALLPTVVLLALINSWIIAILLDHPDPGVVLASAITAISFLLVVGYVVTRVSRAVGDAIDRTQTERKRTEETLRESEGKLRSIFEGALDGILVADKGTRKFLSGNPAICRMLGYTLEEIVRLGIPDIHPKQDLPHAIKEFERLLRGESQMAADIPVMRKDGSVFYADIKAVSIRIGGKDGLLGTFRDVTERKRVERELQHKTELAQLLEQLARAANEAVSPDAAMENCLARICEHGKWVLGRVATFRPTQSHDKPAYSQWFCAEPARFGTFMSYSDGFSHGTGTGTFVSLVLREQRPVWLPDLTALETPPGKRLAKAIEAGLKAAFAFPVIVRGDVVAVLEFFATQPQPLDALLMEGTGGLASQFARMIERSRADETQARLAAIVEHSNDAVVGLDFDRTILSWNAAAERLFGYSAAEVIGRKSSLIIPADQEAQVAQRRELINDGFSPPAYDTVRLGKDGRRVDVAIAVSPVKDASGKMMGISLMCRDITQRKRAQVEHAQLAAIVESSNDAILTRGPDRTILSWNAAAERLFGWSAREAVGQSIDLIILPERIGTRRGVIERVERGEPVSPVESIHLRKDGSRFPTQITFSPIRDGHGNVIAHSLTVRDLTELKRNEDALRSYAARLRELSHRLREVEESERRAISRELHDRIGQGLTTLGLMVGALDARLSRESRSAVQTLLKDMQALVRYVVAHVRDVMAELRPPVLDDYGLLAALRQLVSEFANRTGIAVNLGGVDPYPRLPLFVETAMFRISQEALNNIAKHAHAKKVEISLNRASERVVLDIADDGVGFDAGNTPDGGEHWGMITMRERAEAAGIMFRLESAPGAGTRIVLEVERAAT